MDLWSVLGRDSPARSGATRHGGMGHTGRDGNRRALRVQLQAWR